MTPHVTSMLAVGLGGFLGAVLRYGITIVLPKSGGLSPGVLVANVLGCFLAGYVVSLVGRTTLNPTIALFALTGFLGSFTTFSALGLDLYEFIRSGRWDWLLLTLALHLILGVVSVGAGFWLGSRHLF